MYVTPSFVLCVSTPGLKGFSIERLEDWLDTSVVTSISQEVGRCVLCSDILPCGKSWRGQLRMLSHSSTCEVVQILTMAEAEGVPEIALMQEEALITNGKGCNQCRGTLP